MMTSQATRHVSCYGRLLRNALNVNGFEAIRCVTAVTTEKYECPELATAKPFEEIPKIPILPFIGSIWAYLPIIGRYKPRMMQEADRHKHELYGDIVRERLGHLNVVSSFAPETMEVFFRNEGQYPTRGEISSLKAYRESRKEWYKSTGVMILQGKEWADLRKKTQKHLMKPRAIQSFLYPMQDVARDFIKRIIKLRDSDKEVHMLLEELYKWALESVAYVGLDTRLGCLSENLELNSDGKIMIESVQAQFDCINKLEAFTGNIQFWKYFATPTWKKFTKACDDFTEIAFKYINRSLDELKKNADSDKELTLLQSMLLTKGLDSSGAMVMVADMLTAGIDTTSNTVGFLMYHLAKNPEKQEILYNEISKLLPNKNDRITPESFQKLHYLKACLKEAIRLDPVVRGIPRVLNKDVVISGYRVPAGVNIVCLTQVIFRNEKYFKDPNKFIPERWFNKDEMNPFSFVPFGVGTRSCIGRRLAELEMLCLSTEIIRNFRLEYHYEDIGMESRFVNVPDKPLRFTFLDR